MAPTNNPGIVDGENTGEDMGLGYDDSNPPTDQGGDQITDGDDTIYGNGGDDTIDGAGGDDLIYGGSGGETSPITITVDESEAAFDNQLFVYTIDPVTGAISNQQLLSANVKDDLGTTFTYDAAPGAVIGVGIISPEGTYYSSGYGANVGLNTDGLPHTGLIDQAPDGAVTLGFEDRDNLGDSDFDDVIVTVDLGTSGASFDNCHVTYTSDPSSGDEGNDVIDGNIGDDTIYGEGGDDTLSGNEGDDVIDGGTGNDVVDGGPGDDTLTGGRGDDTITGGDGNDVVVDMDGDNVIDTSSDAGISALPDLGYPGLFPADGDPDDDRDSVTTGSGDDHITTGDDADTIVSGGGNDTINAGIDADEIYGGRGDDLITSGEGSDFVEGGSGNDTIYGGLGPSYPDELNITDDDTGFPSPDQVTNNGMDTIYAGLGDDVVYGEDDDDEIHGQGGNDYLDGGIDDDTIHGGEGEDTLIGGQGDDHLTGGRDDDVMTGGDGNDVFVEFGNDGADTVTDFGVGDTGPINDGDQTNNDFINLHGFYNSSTLADVNAAGGDFDSALEMLRADAEDGHVDGVIGGTDYSAQIGEVDVTLQDGSGGAVTGSDLTYDNTNVPCFVGGTLIATRHGSVPVEELKVGDEVITMDHGFQKIRWIGSTTVPATGRLAPVVIRRGAMGNERDLRVSPQHRMLVRGWHVELMFGRQEALVPAKALINDKTVFQLEGGNVDYFHILFDQHELIYAEGIPSESFHPGHVGLGAFAEGARDEILALFPELREDATAYSKPVRPTLKVREARVLAENPELMQE